MYYKERINDGRKVFVNGKLINEISENKYFRKTVELIQSSLELAFNVGDKINTLSLPKNYEELKIKGDLHKKIAFQSQGMLGRTPDFMNTAISALYQNSDYLGRNEYVDFEGNAKKFYERVKNNKLFIAHGAINPQIDRSKKLSDLDNKYSGVYYTTYNSDGIWVNGAKMIVTLAPIADEILIFNMPGLVEGDEKFALAFSVPVNAEGLKIICRKTMSKSDSTIFDFPISNWIDELDAYLVFDNVFIPWDRVLIFRDIEKSNSFFDATHMRHHSGYQDIIRGKVKLEFIVGILISVAEMLGLNNFLPIQEKLGRALTYINQIESAISSSELNGSYSKHNIYTPNIEEIMSIRYNLPIMYQNIVDDILKLCGSSMLSTPTYNDFLNENQNILKEALNNGIVDSYTRVALLNLAWDISGDSHGQRQLNYEYFHGGDPMRIAANFYKGSNRTEELRERIWSFLKDTEARNV